MPVPENHIPGGVITAADINALATLANTTEAAAGALGTTVAGKQPLDADLTTFAALDSATAGVVASDGSGWIRKSYAQLKTALGLVKGDVGLGNVDNTADTAKPISTATQTALDLKAPLASPAFTGTPTKGGSALLSSADASGAYALDAANTLYVTATGSDSNDGLAPAKAKATINGALAAIAARGASRTVAVSGKIMVGPGTFAPFSIDATSTYYRGIKIEGAGVFATQIVGTSTTDCVTGKTPGSGAEPSFIEISNMRLTGGRDGLNIGSGSWADGFQNWNVHDVECSNNTRDGIRAFDFNACMFSNVSSLNNGGYGVRLTGRSTDGTGGVTNGNTTVWTNVATNNNALGGWLFDQCGLNHTIIGGEQDNHPTNKYAVTVLPGVQSILIQFLGVHWERNWRDVLLGDAAASGQAASQIKFANCYLGSNGDYNVVCNVVRDIDFDNVRFGAIAGAGIKLSNAADTFSYRNAQAAADAYYLLEDAAAVKYSSLKGAGTWGRPRRVVQGANSDNDDAMGVAADYIETQRTGVQLLRRIKSPSGTVDLYLGTGSPEGVVTAPRSSRFYQLDGNAGKVEWIKGNGTGNTGWAPPYARQNFTTITTQNYSITGSDVNIKANVTNVSAAIFLPGPGGTYQERVFVIKNINANPLAVTPAFGNIDGGTTDTLAQYAVGRYYCDGTQYWKV